MSMRTKVEDAICELYLFGQNYETFVSHKSKYITDKVFKDYL